MGKKWTLESAKSMITRNDGMIAGSKLWHPRPGIKMLGAIDYLVKKHKYVRVREL